MTTIEENTMDPAAAPSSAPSARARVSAWRTRVFTDDVNRGLRWGLTTVWVAAFAYQCVADGIPTTRADILAWLAGLLLAANVGRRRLLTVVIDFLPFAAVLSVYDYLRGLSDTAGMPTWWRPQVDVDKFLFFGHEPTVWLQEHLRYPSVQWYDVIVSLCYFSFFFLPYLTAAVMWWRSRRDFFRWAGRFVSLSFTGFLVFILAPAAPPWAAAMCTPADVASHPHDPSCMYHPTGAQPGNLLGAFHSAISPSQFVERISTRGFDGLHLHFAAAVIKTGQGQADLVAAMPSLHLGGTMLFCAFMWTRLRKRWRPVLIAYPLLMTFSLTYSGEHYVIDCIAGAALAVVVHKVANRVERRIAARRAPDTLDGSPTSMPESLEPECLPSRPLPEMTPSSIFASGVGSSSRPATSTAELDPPGTTVRSE